MSHDQNAPVAVAGVVSSTITGADSGAVSVIASGIAPGPLSIAVIGHQGRMGAMLAAHWQTAGHTVRGADREAAAPSAHDLPPQGKAPRAPQSVKAARHTAPAHSPLMEKTVPSAISVTAMQAAVEGAAVVVLCVPVQALQAVLENLAPLLLPTQILCDVTSVKVLPMQMMERAFAGPVVGTHPLFGPVHTPEDLHLAVTPGTHATGAHTRLVRSLFEGFGCHTFITTPEEHDRSVAFVQGLNFISSAAYFASLAHREELLPFLTPSFRRRLEGARKLLTEDAGMFQGFTTANPMTQDAIHTFRLFLDLVERGGLADVAREARWWYEEEK